MKKYPIYLIATLNAAVVIGLWLTGFAYLLDPRTFSWLALGGYAFPLMLILTLAFLVVWVFIKKRYMLISIAGLLVAYVPVTLYFPVNTDSEVPQDAIHVITFNTHSWGHEKMPDGNRLVTPDEPNPIAQYLADCNADVVCVQEGGMYHIWKERREYLDSIYPHIDTLMGKGGAESMILSKFPITRKELIPIDTKSNIVGAFWVKTPKREVIFINCHLQVTGLSIADRQNFHSLVKGDQEKDSIKHTSKTIVGKLLESSKQRVTQAQAVASFVRMHKGTPMVVCGDFNDIPHSYVHHTIGEELTDCYRATAFGTGFSFKQYGMRVRIDNIMCSKELTPYQCHTDNSIAYSDHFPVHCYLTTIVK